MGGPRGATWEVRFRAPQSCWGRKDGLQSPGFLARAVSALLGDRTAAGRASRRGPGRPRFGRRGVRRAFGGVRAPPPAARKAFQRGTPGHWGSARLPIVSQNEDSRCARCSVGGRRRWKASVCSRGHSGRWLPLVSLEKVRTGVTCFTRTTGSCDRSIAEDAIV